MNFEPGTLKGGPEFITAFMFSPDVPQYSKILRCTITVAPEASNFDYYFQGRLHTTVITMEDAADAKTLSGALPN